MPDEEPLTFAISLSVLNHLGRNLYRSFATVLGEAISNSWDADAENVWLFIDKEKGSFFIKDDGNGMSRSDFQNKFLKIGYSKRKNGESSPKGRPYIGRKGIGKLALLSCAKRITVITKVIGGTYVGGVIDNSGLDVAIHSDLDPEDYVLGNVDWAVFRELIEDHEKGTIIYFEEMNDGIRNSLEYIRKLIALYFRFSLVDDSFKIHVDGERITLDDLADLIDKTEYLWKINDLNDPYITTKLVYSEKNEETDAKLIEPPKAIKMNGDVKGFIASVRVPSNLKVFSTEEKVGIDLFVNGRLREKDLLRHIAIARVTENYLYGQIHFNNLDDPIKDRFSSSREGVVPDDEKFADMLKDLQKLLRETIFVDWDNWRRKHRKTGDPDNPSISKKERKGEEMFNEVAQDYEEKRDPKHPRKKGKVDKWVDELVEDARYNISSYAECFISENLIRKHIQENKIPLSPEAAGEVSKWKETERGNMGLANISIQIRKLPIDTSYLDMDNLANLVDKGDNFWDACLSRDAREYKPIRDAMAHTALLTEDAKGKLTTVYANIKGRVKTLLVKNP